MRKNNFDKKDEKQILERFQTENGSYVCKELLKCDLGTVEGVAYAREHQLFTEFCPDMVASVVRILEELIEE